MRIGIVGAGALGTLFGQRLAASNEVVLLERKREVVDAVGRDGLRVDGEARPAHASSEPRDLYGVQVLFVFVRATDTLRALRPFAAQLSPATAIVSLQNGLGNEEAIKTSLGGMISLVIGATTESALTVGAAETRRIGEGNTVLGSAGASPEVVNRVVRLLVDAGLRATAAYDIRPHLWGKLIANAAINPVAALLDRPNGVVLTDAHAGDVARSLAQEAATVANAMRIPLPFSDPWSYVRTIVEQTAELDNSMLYDLRAGAPTEVDFINGAVVSAGRRAAVPTPYNETLTALVKAREATRSAR
ncbi:MAG: 2-dehydropantoate 2-reductase [Candidatus Eremiobacteraeota bacterium]|jgi:2-dehydropantoate 2-reductase|nr:2-dehydropantoate 2-reductase [Candidatus Eremiobacteraeota bacterium]